MRRPTYSAATDHYDHPAHFFNGDSFRLVHVEPSASPVFTFTEGTYFEAYDTSEPLGFEAAAEFQKSGGATVLGSYREWLADPFDLTRRCGCLGQHADDRRSRKDITFYCMSGRRSRRRRGPCTWCPRASSSRRASAGSCRWPSWT